MKSGHLENYKLANTVVGLSDYIEINEQSARLSFLTNYNEIS